MGFALNSGDGLYYTGNSCSGHMLREPLIPSRENAKPRIRRDSTFYGIHTTLPSDKKLDRMREDTLANRRSGVSGKSNVFGQSLVSQKQKLVGKHRKSILGVSENDERLIELHSAITQSDIE